MKGDDGAHNRCDLGDEVEVVGLDEHGFDKFINVEVWKEVEDILQVVNNLIADRQLSANDFNKICANLVELGD